MKARRLLASVGIVLLAALGGSAAAWRPTWFIALAVVLVVLALPLARLAWRLPLSRLAAALLIAIQVSYVMRHTWFDIDYVPAFKYIRLPLLVILPAAGVLGGFALVLRSPVRRVTCIALAYGIWVIVAGQWGIDPGRTIFYGSWLLLLVLNVSMVIALADDPKELWGMWLKGLGIIGLICCVGCIIAMATGEEIVRSDRWIAGAQRRAYRGLFFNANMMGAQGVVTLAAPLAHRTLFPQQRGLWMPLVLALSGVVILASASRGCFVAYVIGVTLYTLQSRGSRSIRRRTVVVLGVAALALTVASTTDIASSTLDRIAGTASSVETGEEGRIHIWKTYIERTIEHPIVGSGFINSALEGDYVALRSALRAHSPHSVLIQYMVGPGIPAGLLFAWLLFHVGRRMRGWRSDPLRGSVLAFVLVLSPLFLGSTVTGPRDWGTLLMWLPLLLIGSLPLISEQTAADEASPVPAREWQGEPA